VGDVEQTGSGSGVQVLLKHTKLILHWHFVASEGHHTRAKVHMKGMERRPP
jgi:hypothetical protein